MKLRNVIVFGLLLFSLVSLSACRETDIREGKTEVIYELEGGTYQNCTAAVIDIYLVPLMDIPGDGILGMDPQGLGNQGTQLGIIVMDRVGSGLSMMANTLQGIGFDQRILWPPQGIYVPLMDTLFGEKLAIWKVRDTCLKIFYTVPEPLT